MGFDNNHLYLLHSSHWLYYSYLELLELRDDFFELYRDIFLIRQKLQIVQISTL